MRSGRKRFTDIASQRYSKVEVDSKLKKMTKIAKIEDEQKKKVKGIVSKIRFD